MFSMQSESLNSLIATFQLSSAGSLNLGQSQNSIHVFENGLHEKLLGQNTPIGEVLSPGFGRDAADRY